MTDSGIISSLLELELEKLEHNIITWVTKGF